MFTEQDLKASVAYKIIQRVAGDSIKREDIITSEFYEHEEFADGLIESIRVKIVEDPRSEISLCFDFRTGEMLMYILLCDHGEWAYEYVGEDTIETTLKKIVIHRLNYFNKDQIESIFE